MTFFIPVRAFRGWEKVDFGAARLSRLVQVDGGWWMDDTHASILNYSQLDDGSLTYDSLTRLQYSTRTVSVSVCVSVYPICPCIYICIFHGLRVKVFEAVGA